MYRKLIAIPLLGFVGLSLAGAHALTSTPDRLLHGLTMGFRDASATVFGSTPVVLTVLGLLVAAMRVGTFSPSERYPAWLTSLKYAALAAGLALALVLLTQRANWTAYRAAVLFHQTQAPLFKVLAASYLLRSLPEAIGLSFFLAAPFFWLIRGVQVRSLRRATFEAWVEARRLVLPAMLLLAAGAALEAWAGPALTTWMLR
jgi:hypothetical protein